MGGDKARAHIGQVGAHGLRGENLLALGNGARQDDRAVIKGANFRYQREGAELTGVTTSASTDQNQAINAGLDGLFGVFDVDHVVEHQTAVAVDRANHFIGRTQAGDDDRHLILHAQFNVMLQAVIAAVHDLVDRKGRHLGLGVGRLVVGQLGGDALQPFVQHLGRAGIERRKGTDDPGLALGNDQIRVGDDKQRGTDDRQAQIALQNGGQTHACAPLVL